ncbi:hypothetical protein [Bacillus cereus group sp. BfR-BA-01380]|uniref:hypothetical protein n=1 Tax=Bacillus cereus group sp. BfR-BA-01380 TaxID=2920324 RepID=UPI001F591029|nr:hypothetical protein [Bacillus cereus group sp. BfR-BA-01380]
MIYKRKRFVFQMLLVSICLLVAMCISSGALYTQTILKELLKQEQSHNTDGWEVPETSKKKEEIPPWEKEKRIQTKSKSKKGGGEPIEQVDNEVEKRNTAPLVDSKSFPNQQLFLMISVITIVLVMIVVYSLKRKRGKSEEEIIKMSSEQKSEDAPIQQVFSFLPKNKIRAAVAQWERTLPQYEQRRPFETIQKWLFRIQKSKDIVSIYEGVRYGHRDASSEAVEKVKKWTEEN